MNELNDLYLAEFKYSVSVNDFATYRLVQADNANEAYAAAEKWFKESHLGHLRSIEISSPILGRSYTG